MENIDKAQVSIVKVEYNDHIINFHNNIFSTNNI